SSGTVVALASLAAGQASRDTCRAGKRPRVDPSAELVTELNTEQPAVTVDPTPAIQDQTPTVNLEAAENEFTDLSPLIAVGLFGMPKGRWGVPRPIFPWLSQAFSSSHQGWSSYETELFATAHLPLQKLTSCDDTTCRHKKCDFLRRHNLPSQKIEHLRRQKLLSQKKKRVFGDGTSCSRKKKKEEFFANIIRTSHCLHCTESFMRENVVEEMRQLQPDDENKQKILDILKRFHSEEEMDNMDEDVISAFICLRGMRGDWRALPTVGILMMDGLVPALTAMGPLNHLFWFSSVFIILFLV
ncbi:hypothetical protein LOK49_LG08G00623, partial [Camellia lanceoleosa]